MQKEKLIATVLLAIIIILMTHVWLVLTLVWIVLFQIVLLVLPIEFTQEVAEIVSVQELVLTIFRIL
jgi:hypothetical protein